MVSLRFPFSFSQPPKPPHIPSFSSSRRSNAAVAVVSVAATAAVAGVAVSFKDSTKPGHQFLQDALNFFFSNRSLPLWGSLSLNDSANSVVDSRTGVSFPSVLAGSRRLLGVGMRKKSVLGLKNIDVYAFGVYADNDDIRKFLGEKYGKSPSSEIVENKEFSDDLLESDINMTVRLQIIYSRLSIRSVRSAFEESVGNRLQKFGGSDNKELLQRFTSQFKDEYKIPRGSVIELARERGHVLRTTTSCGVCFGEVYHVGDSHGWTNNAKVDYHAWSSSKKFHVGDVIEFKYEAGKDNVLRVNHESFQTCNLTDPIRISSSGHDLIKIRNPHSHFFFISGVPGHCEDGQKVDIRVSDVSSQSKVPTPSVLVSSPSLAPAPAPSAASSSLLSNVQLFMAAAVLACFAF